MINKENLSVIVPVFNSENTLNDLYHRLINVLVNITNNFEIIFINDASMDKSLGIINSL